MKSLKYPLSVEFEDEAISLIFLTFRYSDDDHIIIIIITITIAMAPPPLRLPSRLPSPSPSPSPLPSPYLQSHVLTVSIYYQVGRLSPNELHLVPPLLAGTKTARGYQFREGKSDIAEKRKQVRDRDRATRWSRFPPIALNVENVPTSAPAGTFSATPEAMNHSVTKALEEIFSSRPIYSKRALFLATSHLDRRSVLRFINSVAVSYV